MKIRQKRGKSGTAPSSAVGIVGSPDTCGRKVSGRRTRIILLLICGAALLSLSGYLWIRGAPPQWPVPGDLDKLDPQLREYVLEAVERVRSAPRNWDRHATLGLVYAANSLWSDARLAFSNVVRLKPNEPLAHLYVGISTHESGEPGEALKIFKELTVRFPNFAPGFYRLGESLLKESDLDGAERAFQRLVDLAPAEWRGHAGVGDVQLRRGNHAEAVRNLDQALRLDWNAARAHHLRGMALRGAGRMEDAELELSLGLNATAFPMPDAWSDKAADHMKLLQDQLVIAEEASLHGQPQKAVGILEEALRFHPTNAMVLNNLAIAYNRSGQPQKARPLLLQLLWTDERYVPAYITLSFTCQLLGSNAEALAFAERAIALSPNAAQSHVAKANSLLAAERDAEAVAALEAAFRCDPNNAEIQLELGDVRWRNLNQPAEAFEHYKKASQLNRTLLKAHWRLAELAMDRRDLAEARAAIQTIRKIAPYDPGLAVLESRFQKLQKP